MDTEEYEAMRAAYLAWLGAQGAVWSWQASWVAGRDWQRARTPAPGTGAEATRAAAERLIGSCTEYLAEHGNPMLAPNLYTDALTVARYVLAGDRAAEGLRKVIARLLETGPDEPLMAELPPSRASYFWFCGRSPRQGHAPDCPWEEMLALAEHEGAEAPRLTCDACGAPITDDYMETLVEGETGEYHVECLPPGMPYRHELLD